MVRRLDPLRRPWLLEIGVAAVVAVAAALVLMALLRAPLWPPSHENARYAIHTAIRGPDFFIIKYASKEYVITGGSLLSSGSMNMRFEPGVGWVVVKGTPQCLVATALLLQW